MAAARLPSRSASEGFASKFCPLPPLSPRFRGERDVGSAPSRRFVGQFDRLAEMRGGLLERGAAERLVAGFSPPFDRRLVEPGLRQMVGDEFRLGRRDRRELSAQGISDLPVQDLPPALEQGFVGRVLTSACLKV